MAERAGLVALFGSGETSSSGRKVYEWVFSRLASPIRVALLETPAGFQPNSALVSQKVASFLEERLQNYRPETVVVPARRRGTDASPDDPLILAPMLGANVIFAGPGSPSYAARQLDGSLAWDYLRAKQRLGSAVLLASAATVAAGVNCLPVYEIYKVGEDLHWRRGLDLFGPYGLSLTFVPHWDNNEGGAELDTSRCFMGVNRFRKLVELLPPDSTIVGIDEHTALVVDLEEGGCRVIGRGGVTLLRGRQEARFSGGLGFPADRLGPFRLPASEDGIPDDVWGAVLQERGPALDLAAPSTEVVDLLRARSEARDLRDWRGADALRSRIESMGWRVVDTPDGPVLERVARGDSSSLQKKPSAMARSMTSDSSAGR